MTLNQVAFGNSTGGLQGSDNLTFNGSMLTLTGAQSISGQLTSTLATGTAPFVVASTTAVANLNASLLLGGTWAIPGSIGATTPNAGAFTTLSASGATTFTGTTASLSRSTGAVVIGNGSSGGLGVGGAIWCGSFNAVGSSTVNNTGGQSLLNIGDNAVSSYSTLRFFGGSGRYNFQLGAQVNVGDTFEITPSTAAGGTTFSTPAFQIAGATGNVTFGAAALSKSATAGIGYSTGAGGTVTQATSKATGVTLSTVCGTITLNAASLAANTSVAFTWTNTAIAATDYIDIQHDSVGTLGAYSICVTPGAGSATVTVRNNTAGALAEAIVLRFFVTKAVTA